MIPMFGGEFPQTRPIRGGLLLISWLSSTKNLSMPPGVAMQSILLVLCQVFKNECLTPRGPYTNTPAGAWCTSLSNLISNSPSTTKKASSMSSWVWDSEPSPGGTDTS
jgi:hypothetical protein